MLGEAGGVAAVAVAVGAVLLRLGIVVDWREPMLGAVLLLTPVLVRHVALGARHRWVALPCAYVVLAVCGYLIGRLVEPAWPVTAAGFLGAAGGALLGGAAFALISHFGGPTAAIEPAGDNQEPVRRLSYGPRLLSVTDEDTDTLPEVGALRDRDERGS